MKCVRCQTPVPASPDEVAWVCEQCGQGLLLEDPHGLVPQKVHFAAGIPPGKKGNPYWAAAGQIHLQRETQSSFRRRDRDAAHFWGQPRRFFIPAFDCELDTLISTGVGMLRNPPRLGSGPPSPFAPVTLARGDVIHLAEFIVMAIEAERKDEIKSINFDLQLSQPELWILPP